MAPTTAGSGNSEHDPLEEPVPVAGRRRPARTLIASLAVIAVIAAAVGLVVATGDDSSPTPLVLTPNAASPAKESPAVADTGFASAYRYRLAIAAPDLGSDAPVGRLVAPTVDAERVRTMAAAFGLDGDPTRTDTGGWQVVDGASRLTIEPTAGGWDVNYGSDTPDVAPGAVPGSDVPGSTGSSGDGRESDSSSGSGSAPAEPVEPAAPLDAPTATTLAVPPPTVAAPPQHLPTGAESEKIARTLLERLGVIDGSWSASIEAMNAADSVACAPEPCPMPAVPTTTRTVVLHPMFDSIAIDGISWQVVLGDDAKVVSVYGTWATLRTLDRYPLRPVADVFADLVAGKGTSPFPVPMSAIEPDGAAPDYQIQPIDVAIDHVARGYAVVPASAEGRAVIDVVPTYVFSGSANGAGDITQELVAVNATVMTPFSGPNIDPGTTPPPIGKPEPQPLPATPEPTVSGTPLP